jgi:hypothetical protein
MKLDVGKTKIISNGSIFWYIIQSVQSAGWLDIHFTVGTSYERAVPLADKNAAAGLSDFSVSGAARRHFSQQVVQLFRRKFRR